MSCNFHSIDFELPYVYVNWVSGCDQKHEEEMDSEAIYKNFVLRVSASASFFYSSSKMNSLLDLS